MTLQLASHLAAESAQDAWESTSDITTAVPGRAG